MNVLLYAPMLALACASCVGPARAAVESPPDRAAQAEDLRTVGMRALRAGDSGRAQQYLSASLELGARADDVLSYLLLACIKARQYRAAVNYGETYRGDLTLRTAEVQLLIGSIYLGLEQYLSARQAFESVLEQDPNQPTAHYLLGSLLRNQFQEYALASAHFQAYLEQEPLGQFALAAKAGLLRSPSVRSGAD